MKTIFNLKLNTYLRTLMYLVSEHWEARRIDASYSNTGGAIRDSSTLGSQGEYILLIPFETIKQKRMFKVD